MSGPDPNTNLSPVVSQPQGGAPQGAAPAYIAPARTSPIDALRDPTPVYQPQPGPQISPTSSGLPTFDGGVFGTPVAPPPAAAGAGGFGDFIKRIASGAVSAPGSGGPFAGGAPATATDAVAAPKPGNQAAQHSAAGTPMSTFTSGEQHPQTHTLEDFVNANRHLTLHDITKLMPGILPGMDPHRQMVNEAYAGLVSQRDAAFKQALELEHKGDVAGANALRQHAASEHMKNLMPLIASNNPYAAMGAAQSYGTTP